MRFTKDIMTKKVSRKSFIFYSGLFLVGAYALLKAPFKFFGDKNKDRAEVNAEDGVQFKANPGSVKRG